MTDHTNLAAKIAIRLHFLEKLKSHNSMGIKVLECYAGESRDIYKTCYVSEETISLDKKGGKGVIKIDNRKYIAAHASNFNYFDLDAYGSPYELLLNIFKKRKEKEGVFVIIITDGLFRNLNYGKGSNLIKTVINNRAGISIPALNRHHDFIIRLLIKTFMDRFNIKIEECKIIKDEGNQMRYLGMLCVSQ